jgi:hypothetical protein
LRDGYTTEQTEDYQQDRVEQGGDEDRRAEGRNGLTEGDGEDFGDEDHGEHVTGSRSLVLETNGEVPQKVESDGANDAVLLGAELFSCCLGASVVTVLTGISDKIWVIAKTCELYILDEASR